MYSYMFVHGWMPFYLTGIVLNGGADTPGHALTIHSVAEDGIAHDDGFLKVSIPMKRVLEVHVCLASDLRTSAHGVW